MFEFTNVLDVSYGAYVVDGAYHGVGASGSNSTPAPSHDEAVALIRELLDGDVASVRQSAGEASTAVSTIQYLADAVDTIAAKLSVMQELAKKAHSHDYSQVQLEDMQEQFKDFAARINQTTESTEYNYNKLFTFAGKAVSIYIGDGSKVDIFARDFSFNAQGLDITADPEAASSKIKGALANIGEYRDYLSRQAARAERATAVMESEIEGAMGVDFSDFTPELAVERTSNTANLLSKDTAGSLDTQANVTPRRALQLMKRSE